MPTHTPVVAEPSKVYRSGRRGSGKVSFVARGSPWLSAGLSGKLR
jgi:hypothetical protein